MATILKKILVGPFSREEYDNGALIDHLPSGAMVFEVDLEVDGEYRAGETLAVPNFHFAYELQKKYEDEGELDFNTIVFDQSKGE
jgi:hypothetical protein